MALLNKWKFVEDSDLSGCTLIIPSVSVGNIGQFVCDLLISSLQMQRIASLYTPALVPVLGYNPYDLKSSSLSGCCELYKCQVRKILVLQIRAPLIYKYGRKFLDEIVDTFKDKNVKDFVILTSSFAHEKKHISTSPFRYIVNDPGLYKNEINNINLTKHEATDTEPKIYGGGFASLLYKISTEKSVPCLILYKYCSEGDNIPDSYEIINCLSKILPLFSVEKELATQITHPVSWKLFYGRPPPKNIY